jgi:nitrite reductase/ring-hydroxylating ferredoxin subunit
MPEFVKVAETKDVPPGESLVVTFAGERVAIFNIDGRFYAISEMCPHAGGPLSEGYVSGTSVMCPWHGWTFDLCPSNPDINDGVTRYKVSVEGNDILLESPE